MAGKAAETPLANWLNQTTLDWPRHPKLPAQNMNQDRNSFDWSRLQKRRSRPAFRGLVKVAVLAVFAVLARLGAAPVAIQTNSAPTPESFRFRTPTPMVCVFNPQTGGLGVAPGHGDWLMVGATGSAGRAFELGDRLVLRLKNPADLAVLTAGANLRLARQPAPDVFILQASDPLSAARQAHRLAGLPGVVASYPVMRRPVSLNFPYAYQPSDSEFGAEQWNLENRDTNGASLGMDINVRAAWPYTMGQGVTIAIADTGIEMDHVELTNSVAAGPHFNFALQNTNAGPVGTSSDAAHGTQCAGLVAAEINNARMVGAAPAAGLASWVIFDTNLVIVPDDQLMDMYGYAPDTVAVQNHSWGPGSINLAGPTALEDLGISNAVAFSRGGLGAVMVRAGGNLRAYGGNSNDNGYCADRRVIAVGAVRQDGRVASYGSPGACLLVAAPSGDNNNGFDGLFSTDLPGAAGANPITFFPPNQDLSDYVFGAFGFSGTSASAPQVSAIAALLLSANPSLTYRDVQQILILSSRHFDFADPDLATNAAGFPASHNLGFGIPDAGQAVRMALGWPNRPALASVAVTATNVQTIPGAALRVLVSGDGIPAALQATYCLPDLGVQADNPTFSLPLVDIGFATNAITVSLANKGALIERGVNGFAQKLTNAANAGAAFAVVYNYPTNDTVNSSAPGGDQLFPMGSTDFIPIPAVFIGNTAGSALQALFQTNSSARAQISMAATNYSFTVTNTFITEHVALRVMTDSLSRSGIRITLVSPAGTRSVLERYNADTEAGPVDWTYVSTHHFYESSAGVWTAYFSDESPGASASVLGVTLTVFGVPIKDTDHDGLDDDWEIANFGNLDQGPAGDPDHDGYSNMREQIMGTNPNKPPPFQAWFSPWSPTIARVSWPGSPAFQYTVRAGTNAAALAPAASVNAIFPDTEWFVEFDQPPRQFFQIQQTSAAVNPHP
jgi:subtilisin family serine protease